MSNRPTSSLFKWARTSTIIKEPKPAKKDQGWKIGEKVPAQWLNWILQYITDWISYAITRTDYYDSVLVPHLTDINAHSDASTTQRGFMSASDKTKLNDLHNYIPPSYYTIDQVQNLGVTLNTKANVNGNAQTKFEADDGLENKEVVNISQFPSTLTQNGTASLPSGLITKWGLLQDISLNGVEHAITFAEAFPNQCFNIEFTVSKTDPTTTSTLVLKKSTLSISGCTVFTDNNSVAENGDIYYKALGY